MAIGPQIYEAKGKQTVFRVLGEGKVEATDQAMGKFLGHEGQETATVVSEIRPDGSLFGNVNGIFATRDGQAVMFKGQGIGWWKPDGGVTFRGAVYYWTASPSLAPANKVVGVYEFDADAAGNVAIKTWEWK